MILDRVVVITGADPWKLAAAHLPGEPRRVIRDPRRAGAFTQYGEVHRWHSQPSVERGVRSKA
jgi:hypothetical protein